MFFRVCVCYLDSFMNPSFQPNVCARCSIRNLKCIKMNLQSLLNVYTHSFRFAFRPMLLQFWWTAEHFAMITRTVQKCRNRTYTMHTICTYRFIEWSQITKDQIHLCVCVLFVCCSMVIHNERNGFELNRAPAKREKKRVKTCCAKSKWAKLHLIHTCM